MTGESDDAEAVTDLRQAQRIIAHQRRVIAELQELCEPAAGEFSAFLDAKHAAMLEMLYRQCELFEGQDAELELTDAFSEFVAGWIDVQWDIVRAERENALEQVPGSITPSA